MRLFLVRREEIMLRADCYAVLTTVKPLADRLSELFKFLTGYLETLNVELTNAEHEKRDSVASML